MRHIRRVEINVHQIICVEPQMSPICFGGLSLSRNIDVESNVLLTITRPYVHRSCKHDCVLARKHMDVHNCFVSQTPCDRTANMQSSIANIIANINHVVCQGHHGSRKAMQMRTQTMMRYQLPTLLALFCDLLLMWSLCACYAQIMCSGCIYVGKVLARQQFQFKGKIAER